MRAVIQRVDHAEVTVAGAHVSSIGGGLLVLVGVADGDSVGNAEVLADKLVALRIFGDDTGRMNLSVGDVGGEVLVVPQFTLLGDARKGRRPSFTRAAHPDDARAMVDALVDRIAAHGVPVANGAFGEHMHVTLLNDGPVTLVIDVVDGSIVWH